MNTADNTRPFSLRLYLLVIIAFSWPFQFAFLWLGEAFRPLLLVAMGMAGVGTWYCAHRLFRDAGPGPARHRHWPSAALLALVLPLVLWGLPTGIEALFDARAFPAGLSWAALLTTFLLSFLITLAPALGEEYSWRAYLLPRLLQRHSPRRALLLHGVVTWAWHLPFLFYMGAQTTAPIPVGILATLAISLIPTVLHAVVFAAFWRRGGLAVAVLYHSAYDETRDSLDQHAGLSAVTETWSSLVLSLLGLWLLWRWPRTGDANKSWPD